jgi:diguanylate cyclase (GGDEF)-like protein
VWVRDLGSTNGTFVNGVRVDDKPSKVGNGARVQLGLRTTVRVQLLHREELAAAKALFESSTRDPLTGVCNRRHLDERLESELAFAQRHGTPLSVLMIDIDHFKKINDTLGHPAGDAVLVQFGRLLAGSVRKEDLVARYGGEEFTVLLRDESSAGAAILAERIRSMVESSVIEWQGKQVRYTVSVGVATHEARDPQKSAASLLETADRRLYGAKAAGRNTVVADDSRSVE